jgi:serine protease
LFKARLITLAAATALLTACGGGGGGTLPAGTTPATTSSSDQTQEYTRVSTFTARNTLTGETVRIFPTMQVLSTELGTRFPDASKNAKPASNLLYNGGPVQTSPKLYVVFWGSAWNGSGDPDGVRAQLKAFYGTIGGSSWLNSVTQYTQSDGQAVGNAGNIFAGSYVDTSSTPPRHPTQSQMAAEAKKAAAHFGDYSANASYVVAMPHGVTPSGFGSQYCAYHSSTNASGGTIAWTNLAYIPDAGPTCGVGAVNSPGTLDGVTIVSGHEQAETETDPQPNSGWLDSSGAENGDKCAWIDLENNPDAGGYPTQPLWSNATSSCVQSY